MFDIFNNRELASLIWLIIIFIGLIWYKKTRSSLLDIFKIFFSLKLLMPFSILVIYTLSLLHLLEAVGISYIGLSKDTVIWIVGTGFILFINATKALSDDKYFLNLVKSTLQLSVFISFIANTYVFSLSIEFVIQPIIALGFALVAVASRDETTAQVTTLLNWITACFGFGLIFYFLYNFISNPSTLANFDTLEQLISPIILSLAAIPYLYLFTLIMAYENIFVTINPKLSKNKSLARYAKIKLLISLRGDLLLLRKFNKESAHRIYYKSSHNDVNEIIQVFKREQGKSIDWGYIWRWFIRWKLLIGFSLMCIHLILFVLNTFRIIQI